MPTISLLHNFLAYIDLNPCRACIVNPKNIGGVLWDTIPRPGIGLDGIYSLKRLSESIA